jgi:hypothetical protein
MLLTKLNGASVGRHVVRKAFDTLNWFQEFAEPIAPPHNNFPFR